MYRPPSIAFSTTDPYRAILNVLQHRWARRHCPSWREEADAITRSVAQCTRIGATLLLVCVVTGDDIAEARKYLEGVAQRLRADRFNVQTHVVEGIPADQIIYLDC